MHVHVYSVIETRQSKATMSKDNSSLFPKRKKRSCLTWDLSPRHSAYWADILPTEPRTKAAKLGRPNVIHVG